MMRVLTPNGNVIEVEKAEAIVEKRVGFNGRDIRLCQTAKDKSQPASGLYFSVKTESVFTIANEGNLLVGNLPVDTVKKIVTNLAKDGFCDLSGFDYQPEIGINDKPVFDEGKIASVFLQEQCCDDVCTETEYGFSDKRKFKYRYRSKFISAEQY